MLNNNGQLTFSEALESAKSGMCIARTGWNGANQFVCRIETIVDTAPEYQNDFKNHYATVLDTYREYFCFEGECIYLNDAGLEILNTILVDFMMIE